MRQELIGYNYCSALAVLPPQQGPDTDAQDQLLHRSFWLAKKWPVPLYGISCCESAPLIPQYAWPQLKAHVGVEIAVKHENHTPIVAVKVPGGIVYLDRLWRQRRQVQGIVIATRGNHGQSLAFNWQFRGNFQQSGHQN